MTNVEACELAIITIKLIFQSCKISLINLMQSEKKKKKTFIKTIA